MKCKFCLAELEDNATVCPLCGKDLTEETPVEETAEETPAKGKGKTWKIVLAAVGGVVLAAALTLAVLLGMGIKLKSISAFFGFTKADIYYKSNYSVSDKKMAKRANTVIAKLGDQTLTNEQLQVFYWVAAKEYVRQYQEALYYNQSVELGFDQTKPLDGQVRDPKTGQTWQQYFLETALQQWERYACLCQLAKDAGYVLTKELQQELDNYEATMTPIAEQYGYADVEAYIDGEISKGSSAAAHRHYFEMQYTALGYLETLDKQLVPTEQELEAFYAAHEEDFQKNGCGKDDGKFYDVRHIYITINGTTSQLEDGTYGYTEEQWEECRVRAQKMLDDFLANDPTEEKFAELAKEYSEDPGSATDGGLYSYLTKDTDFIPEFKAWYMSESRKLGDTGLVKNTGSVEKGYHIMYFSGSKEIWRDEAETGVLDEKMEKLLGEASAKYPMDVNYKKLVLGQAELIPQQ